MRPDVVVGLAAQKGLSADAGWPVFRLGFRPFFLQLAPSMLHLAYGSLEMLKLASLLGLSCLTAATASRRSTFGATA